MKEMSKIETADKFNVKVNCPNTSKTILKTVGLCLKGCDKCDKCDVLAHVVANNGISLEEATAYREQELRRLAERSPGPQPGEARAYEEEESCVVADKATPPKRKLKTKKGGLKRRKARERHSQAKGTTRAPKREGIPGTDGTRVDASTYLTAVPSYIERRTVAIAEIVLDAALYPRAGIIEENVERLRGIGPDFNDPIIVSKDLVLVDGRHRLEALKRDGITETEVQVCWYPSTPLLLLHAVQLNCEHGYQLTNEEKKRWVREVWASGVTTEWLSRTVCVSTRTIQDWTSDLRRESKQQRDTELRELVDEGLPVREASRILGVSESTGRRARQERRPAEVTVPPEQDDQQGDDETAAGSSGADHLGDVPQCDKEGAGRVDRKNLIESKLLDAFIAIEEADHLYVDPSTAPFPNNQLEHILEKIRERISSFGTKK